MIGCQIHRWTEREGRTAPPENGKGAGPLVPEGAWTIATEGWSAPWPFEGPRGGVRCRDGRTLSRPFVHELPFSYLLTFVVPLGSKIRSNVVRCGRDTVGVGLRESIGQAEKFQVNGAIQEVVE